MRELDPEVELNALILELSEAQKRLYELTKSNWYDACRCVREVEVSIQRAQHTVRHLKMDMYGV